MAVRARRVNQAWTCGWSPNSLAITRRQGPSGSVQPGVINREMNPETGDMAAVIRQITAPGRYGQPGEIAGAVSFPAGPDAAYITGATLNVDGGVNC